MLCPCGLVSCQRGRCYSRGPLARMHCGCVFVRIRCEGQPQGRCLSRVSCVRRSAVLGADPACRSSPHIRHSITYSERAAPRKGRSVRSQSPEGTENYRYYKQEPPRSLQLVVLLATSGAQNVGRSVTLFFTNGRRVGAIPTCSHVRCVGLSGDGPALVPRGGRVFLIPGRRPSCRVHWRPSLALAVCHEALDHISQGQRRPHMLCAGFLL